jgi:hypothetical protein
MSHAGFPRVPVVHMLELNASGSFNARLTPSSSKIIHRSSCGTWSTGELACAWS